MLENAALSEGCLVLFERACQEKNYVVAQWLLCNLKASCADTDRDEWGRGSAWLRDERLCGGLEHVTECPALFDDIVDVAEGCGGSSDRLVVMRKLLAHATVAQLKLFTDKFPVAADLPAAHALLPHALTHMSTQAEVSKWVIDRYARVLVGDDAEKRACVERCGFRSGDVVADFELFAQKCAHLRKKSDDRMVAAAIRVGCPLPTVLRLVGKGFDVPAQNERWTVTEKTDPEVREWFYNQRA